MIPIVSVILLFSVFYSVYLLENQDSLQKENFYETDTFRSNYMSNVYSSINRTQKDTRYSSYLLGNEEDEQIYYENNSYPTSDFIKYLIIDTETNIAYTNLEVASNTNSIEKIKEEIVNNGEVYWNYEQGEIGSNMDELKTINYSYISQDVNLEKYEIYTSMNEKISMNSGMFWESWMFQNMKTFGTIPMYFIPISIILLAVFIIYLIVAIGHKKGEEKINLTSFDKMPLDVITLVVIMVLGVILSVTVEISYITYSDLRAVFLIIMYILVGLIVYSILALWITTVIKRLKTHTFLKSTLIYKLWHKMINFMKSTYHIVFDHLDINAKIIVGYGLSILLSIMLCLMGGIGIFLVLIFWGYLLYKILKKVKDFRIIKETLQKIYQGDTNIHLQEEEFKGEFKEIARYINDIAGGFSNAIEESLKSERLKTELITNVSHDIKTPLTSIINYVDLLKQEDMPNEKAKEYLQILDKKSQRLKKLTEDLIEASKVSSGNLRLNLETINMKELVNQTTGEFEDRFKQKGLKIETTMPKEEIYIKADTKYMYRIIENLFINICKYALENSRVYIDMIEEKGKVKISLKNISKEKLNISAEELMQRFVRGDKSRTTEGSGLRNFYFK